MAKKTPQYRVVKGFNVGKDNVRYDVGQTVIEKDFSPGDWKALLEMEAIEAEGEDGDR